MPAGAGGSEGRAFDHRVVATSGADAEEIERARAKVHTAPAYYRRELAAAEGRLEKARQERDRKVAAIDEKLVAQADRIEELSAQLAYAEAEEERLRVVEAEEEAG